MPFRRTVINVMFLMVIPVRLNHIMSYTLVLQILDINYVIAHAIDHLLITIVLNDSEMSTPRLHDRYAIMNNYILATCNQLDFNFEVRAIWHILTLVFLEEKIFEIHFTALDAIFCLH